MSDVAERVRKVVAEVLNADESKMTDDARFVQDLGAESIKAMELIASFEEEFDIEMEEDDALECKTIAAAVSYIESQV